eukprot:TRINITY_DN13137_c0_g1_i1.p1 TRINITY_DN13137_c0_g1~~TRINITY_DN13137_c0_g1_i1.p1  ORF type:complete len:706 (+),score=137.01 TRINITY_DN13137_c0_g1_i1:197-2119(+)
MAWAEEERDGDMKGSSSQSTDTPISPVRLVDISPSVTCSREHTPQVDGDSTFDDASHISDLRVLARDVKSKIAQNTIIETSVACDTPKHQRIVETELRDRLASTKDLTKVLDDQIEAINRIVSEVHDSMLHLRRAYRQKWAPLCVCRRRAEIRSERPPSTDEQDKLQVSLQLELEVVSEARQELSKNLEATKAMLPPLDDIKNEMLEDLHKKRFSYRIDHLCLLEGGNSKGTFKADLSVSRQSFLTANQDGLPSGISTPRGGSTETAAARQLRLQFFVTRTQNLIGKAHQQMDVNVQCIASTESECARASSATTLWLNRHISELAASRKPIEAQIAETDKLIQQARVSAAKLGRQLKQSDTPAQIVNRQLSLRQHRVTDELMRDKVQERMEDHLQRTRKNSQTLASQKEETVDLVKALRDTKRELQESLHVKSLTLRVDMLCSKVTQPAAVAHYLARSKRTSGACTSPGGGGVGGAGQAGLDVEEGSPMNDFASPSPRGPAHGDVSFGGDGGSGFVGDDPGHVPAAGVCVEDSALSIGVTTRSYEPPPRRSTSFDSRHGRGAAIPGACGGVYGSGCGESPIHTPRRPRPNSSGRQTRQISSPVLGRLRTVSLLSGHAARAAHINAEGISMKSPRSGSPLP